MAAKNPRAALTDMRDAIGRIERYVEGMTLAEFMRDDLKRDAVERCTEIISEASRRLPERVKSKYADVPWQRVAAVGLTVSDAFRLMMVRIAREKRLPFEPLVPNAETIAAMEAARRGELVEVGDADRLLADLNADH